MDSMCISARNEFTTLPENLIIPKSWSHADHVSDPMKDFDLEVDELFKKHLLEDHGFLPLPEEENVDLNSNDSSYTMRGTTSLPSANAVGKCSNLGLTSGFFKDFDLELDELIMNHLFEDYGFLPLPEEENVDLNSNDSS